MDDSRLLDVQDEIWFEEQIKDISYWFNTLIVLTLNSFYFEKYTCFNIIKNNQY